MKKKLYVLILLVATLFLLFSGFMKEAKAAPASATTATPTTPTTAATPTTYLPSYSSWIQDSRIWNSTYGTLSVAGEDSLNEDPPEPNWVEKAFSSVLAGIGDVINNWVAGPFHMRTSEVILGRLNKNVTMNMYCFELTAKNPYGMTGATIYRLFRNIALLMMAVVLALVYAKAALNSTAKALAELKDNIATFIMIFLLLTIAPQIVDLLLFLKDLLIKMLLGSIYSNSSVIQTVDIVTFFRNNFYGITQTDGTVVQEPCKTLVYGFMYLSSTFIGLRFGISYILIAVKQTVLFFLLPLILVVSVFNKNILYSWCKRFIPNLFIPAIDCAVLMIPIVFEQVLRTNISASVAGTGILSTSGSDYSMLAGVIQLVMMYSIIPTRELVLETFGAVIQKENSRGISGAMLMLASRMMRSGGGGGRGNVDSSGSSKEGLKKYQEDAAIEAGLRKGDNRIEIPNEERVGRYNSSMDATNSDSAFSESEKDAGSDIDEFVNGSAENDPELAAVRSQDGDSGIEQSVSYDAESEESLTDTSEDSFVAEPVENGLGNAYGADYDEMDGENGRLENLRNMQEAQDNIAYNDRALSDIAKEDAALERDNAEQSKILKEEEQMQRESLGGQSYKELSEEKQSLQEKNSHIESLKATAEEQRDTKAAEGYSQQILANNNRISQIDSSLTKGEESQRRIEGIQQQINTNNDALQQNQLRKNELQADSMSRRNDISDYEKNEQVFASKNFEMGGNGRVFDNVDDYQRNENLKKLATYQNFDLEQFKNTLSKKEQAEFARERYQHARKEEFVKGAARVGATLVAAPVVATSAMVAAAANVGDSKNVINSTAVTAMGASMLTNKIAKDGTAYVIDNRKELANGVKSVAGNVASTVKTVAKAAAKTTGSEKTSMKEKDSNYDSISERSSKDRSNEVHESSQKVKDYTNEKIENSDTTGETQRKIEKLRNDVKKEIE